MNRENIEVFQYLLPNSDVLLKVYLCILDQYDLKVVKPIFERWCGAVSYNDIILAILFFKVYGEEFIFNKLNSFHKTMILIKLKNSLAEIASIRGLKYQTILDHFALVTNYLELKDIYYLKPDQILIDKITQVSNGLKKKPSYGEIYNATSGQLSFDEIKLAYPFVFF